MALSLRKIIQPLRLYNKCKHCPITHLCLPAKVDPKTLRKDEELFFKAKIIKPGQHLCRQGENTNVIYALRSGIVKSYLSQDDGREQVMGFHMAPEIIGWEGIDSEQGSHAIVALDHCNLCEIPIDKLSELTRRLPELQSQLLQLASRRIHNGNLALLRGNAVQRVASFFLQLSDNYTKLGYPYYLCLLKMTQQDIANYLQLAPETVSRTIKQLQQNSIISFAKKKVYINDLPKLQELAKGADEKLCCKMIKHA